MDAGTYILTAAYYAFLSPPLSPLYGLKTISLVIKFAHVRRKACRNVILKLCKLDTR